MIGVTSIKIQKSAGRAKRNSDAPPALGTHESVQRNEDILLSPNNIGSPQTATRLSKDSQRQSVFRRSFDGRRTSVDEKSLGMVKSGDQDSLEMSRNVRASQERPTAASALEVQRQEGGTQINHASIQGILPGGEREARPVPKEIFEKTTAIHGRKLLGPPDSMLE